MKNSKYIYLLILILVIGFILYFYLSNNSNVDNPQTNTQNFNSIINKDESQNLKTNLENSNLEANNTIKEDSVAKESNISSFATEIKDNSPGRLTNIRITCDIINGTILEPGQTFSFNGLVGQPSTERGYQEATVIIDGEHETGIGGRKLPSK